MKYKPILRFPPKHSIFLKILISEVVIVEMTSLSGLNERRKEAISLLIKHGILDNKLSNDVEGKLGYDILIDFKYKYPDNTLSGKVKKGGHFLV